MVKLAQLDKYQLIKRIAVGGMSEIYLASQGGLSHFERAVILKCIRGDLETDREVLDMFLDEARIAACLKHPNIVHLYDVGEDGNVPYLAMEYIFGRDLMQISERARAMGQELPMQFIIQVMCSALAGLHYAHEIAEYEDKPLRAIHRDVSPQNILVSFDGVTKIVDFGIAKAEARLSHTQAGILKGKYAYMSPEQVRGRALDHRSDQFSLAVVFYEIITNTRLFQRDTDYSTMEAVDACEIPPVRVLRKDVPRRVVRVLKKAMRRNPKRRFNSCKEMEQSLHKLLHGSAVERSDYVANFMRSLFASDLKVRDSAIREADDDERELILSTGFEMIDDRMTKIDELPPPPIAHNRYQQMLQERQSRKTAVKAKGLKEVDPSEVIDLSAAKEEDSAKTDPEGTQPRANAEDSTFKAKAPGQNKSQKVEIRKRGKGFMGDWPMMILVFVVVLLVVLGIASLLSGPSTVTTGQSGNNKSSLPAFARNGLDGFLSVSVSPSVEVILDGQSMGNGAFAKQPLERGMHKIELRQGSRRKKIDVQIQVNKERFIAPEDWQ